MALFGATVHISALIFPALTLHRMAKQAQDAFAEENSGKSYGNYQLIKKVTWILK